MGTNNFYPHENGIYVLPQTSFDQMKEWMETDEFFGEIREDGLTDQDVYDQLAFEEEREYEEFLEHQLGYHLKKAGFNLTFDEKNGREYMQVFRGEKMVAELHLEAGYYDGAQVIVETDPEEILPYYEDCFYNERTGDYQDEPVKARLNEMYTEHNKTLFKVVSKCTTPIIKVGQFSNGVSVYELG